MVPILGRALRNGSVPGLVVTSLGGYRVQSVCGLGRGKKWGGGCVGEVNACSDRDGLILF